MVDKEKLKKLLEDSNIEQKQMAAMVSISEAMMSFIIRGLKEPSLGVIVRISEVLGCTVDDLIIKERR